MLEIDFLALPVRLLAGRAEGQDRDMDQAGMAGGDGRFVEAEGFA